MTDVMAITNNPLVYERHRERITVELLPGQSDEGYLSVLYKARDYIHLGRRLLTHPLSGSVKPGETPYKTVLLTAKAEALDEGSVYIIEDSIVTAKKLQSSRRRTWGEAVLKDLRLIDYSLIFGEYRA